MKRIAPGALLLLASGCQTREPPRPAWRDPSSHQVRRIVVSPGTALEVLDWGGSGPPLVLLSGLGDAAHSFDDFAPALSDSFHVIGFTRRGFGASSQPPTSSVDTLVGDLKAILDSEHL